MRIVCQMAADKADELYQEVIEKDGISQPDPRIGRHLYIDDQGNRIDKVTLQRTQSGAFDTYLNVHRRVIEELGENHETGELDEFVQKQRDVCTCTKQSHSHGQGHGNVHKKNV